MSEKAFDNPGAIDSPASYQPLEPSAPAAVLPGVQLAARRQQLNLTVEHIANQLNLAPRQIQALEADNYGALPGMASVRGFIRAYAKLLKLDAEPLVQAVAGEASATAVEPLGPALSTTPFSDGRSSLAGRRFPLSWLVALAVLALVLLAAIGSQMGWFPALSQSLSRNIDGGLALLHDSGSRPAQTDTASAAASADSASDNAAPATVVISELPAAKPQAKADPAPAPAVQAPAKIEPPLAKAEAPPVKADVAPVAPAAAAAPAVPAAQPAAAKAPDAADPAASKDLLVVKLRQDSWIDIRRSNNSPVVSRLARAGEVETVKVNGPLALTIGNAPGVELSLRGKAIALEAEANSNVAHITLR
jgi:cytoskeleton protein RodZ